MFIVSWRVQFFPNLGKHRSPVFNLCSARVQTLVEKDSPSSRTTKSSFFSRSANFGNVSPFLVGATNTFSELIHPLIKLPNCVLKFYNLSEALGSFGLLPLRGAGTGFVGVLLPLPLIFDPLLYLLQLSFLKNAAHLTLTSKHEL